MFDLKLFKGGYLDFHRKIYIILHKGTNVKCLFWGILNINRLRWGDSFLTILLVVPGKIRQGQWEEAHCIFGVSILKTKWVVLLDVDIISFVIVFA